MPPMICQVVPDLIQVGVIFDSLPRPLTRPSGYGSTRVKRCGWRRLAIEMTPISSTQILTIEILTARYLSLFTEQELRYAAV